MITDYIPKRTYPKSALTFKWGLRAATAVVLVGIYEFQTNEVGSFPEGVADFRYCGGSEESLDRVM